MEEVNHLKTIENCSLCGEIPICGTLYQCPLQHQYCYDCYFELKDKYRGYIENGATCLICRTSGVFTPSKINIAFLNKYKTTSSFPKSYQYNNGYYHDRIHKDFSEHSNEEITVETLFQLPSEKLRILLSRRSSNNGFMTPGDSIFTEYNFSSSEKSTQNSQHSKIPMKCPLTCCQKVVAPTAFLTHFKHEHSTIPKYSVERGKELCLPCDVSIIEHNTNFCLAMITVYEFNNIDVSRSQSSQSVINTCRKFSQQVPIDSFWLMTTGSPEKKMEVSSAIFWLFCSSEETYQCTIELCSKQDSISFCTYCEISVSSHKVLQFQDIANSLHCLLLSRCSFAALLQEGPELHLRITVH